MEQNKKIIPNQLDTLVYFIRRRPKAGAKFGKTLLVYDWQGMAGHHKLSGIDLTLIFFLNFPLIQRHYDDLEIRRMASMDAMSG
jgi:hypothetical protein